jgi:hypothetical protein
LASDYNDPDPLAGFTSLNWNFGRGRDFGWGNLERAFHNYTVLVESGNGWLGLSGRYAGFDWNFDTLDRSLT